MVKVVVSDHALLRFLERRLGVDLDLVRTTIAAAVQGAADKGAAAVIIEGFKYTIEHNAPSIAVVSTVFRQKTENRNAIRPRGEDDPDT